MKQTFVYFLIVAVHVCTSSEIPGHLQPIGHHRPPVGSVEIRTTFPSPIDFFENYVKTSKPVLFKGILENGFLPAYKLWTDDFLKTKYGDDRVTVEFGKKEERGSGGDAFKLSHFIDVYKKENIYMVNDVTENMANDVILPRSIVCGGFQSRIQHVILWFSSGGTKSVLHNDGLDNINCLLDGEKYFVMIDKKHSTLIETEHWMKNGSYHKVDVEKVDMVKYPQFQDISWQEIKMKKGDCLFIPYKWYHHVDSSYKGRNMAVNFWFSHLLMFNKTDCKDVDIDKPVSFSSFRKDENDLDSVNIFREEMLSIFDSDVLSFRMNEFQDIMEGTDVIDRESAGKLFTHIDMDGNQQITPQELETFDFPKAIDAIPRLKEAVDDFMSEESERELEPLPETDNVEVEPHDEL